MKNKTITTIANLSFNPNNGLILNKLTGHTYSSQDQNYVRLRCDGKTTTAHRLMFEKFHGPIPDGYVVDHINGIKNDNRLENLRVATVSENGLNRHRPNKNNTSGARTPGVSYSKTMKKYRVTMIIDGKQQCYGFFNKLEDAEQQATLARTAIFTTDKL